MTARRFGVYDPTRVQRVCLACAAVSRLRFAVVSGACHEHRDTVPVDAVPVTHEPIFACEGGAS